MKAKSINATNEATSKGRPIRKAGSADDGRCERANVPGDAAGTNGEKYILTEAYKGNEDTLVAGCRTSLREAWAGVQEQGKALRDLC